MLSRLSGLASTVLHELSGEGEDAETAASLPGPEFEASQQNGEETLGDVREQLTHMEKLVVQLKNLVREKDAQLQQKDARLQEERQAAEAKLQKLKLQAKVKVANLNKRIEELMEHGGAAPAPEQPGEPLPPAQGDHGRCSRQEEELAVLRRQLQEQEEMVGELRGQLEEATERLSEAQAQVSSLQKEMLEKGALHEEQVLQHQAEMRQLEARSAHEAEMQQNLRQLQRKLEEQGAALLGRTQVVELLQQELNSSEEEKQILLEKFQKAEAELDSLRSTLASVQRESQGLVRTLELAEQKTALRHAQGELQEMRQELAQARAAQAEPEQARQVEEVQRAQEVAEKSQEVAEFQRAEQDLRSGCEAVQAENARLHQQVDLPVECSTEDPSASQGELLESPLGPGFSQPEAETLAAQVLPPPSQPLDQQDVAALPGGDAGELEGELPKTMWVALEASNGFRESDSVEGLQPPGAPAALMQPRSLEEPWRAQEDGRPDLLEDFAGKEHRDLSVLLEELQEAQEEIAFLKGQLQVSSSLEADGGQPQGSDPRPEGEGEVPVQSDSSSSSLVTVDLQDSASVLGVLLGQEDHETTQGPSLGSGLQLEKMAKLELEVADLQRKQQEAAELHGSVLAEKAAQIGRLQEQLEGSTGAVHTLSAERDQLLSQLQELCFLAELKDRREGSLAHSEEQQLSSYETGVAHLGLLKEQIQSLRNEAKSKDVKITALQKDLDESQHRLLEQEILGRNLRGQLEGEEQKARALMGQLQEASVKAEGLSQTLALKELEATRLANLLSENSAEVERLQQEVSERERRMTEVSVGMSDRMVQLNEEKFILRKELKSVMEQLSALQQGKETREQAVETEEKPRPVEELPANEEVEVLRKENELVRKKLQAALLSRRELLTRVRQLEQGGKGGEPPAKAQGGEGVERTSESNGPDGGTGHPVRRGRAASLSQLLSATDTLSQTIPGEKECTWLRAVIAELQHSLQQKDVLIRSLQDELQDCKLAPEEQTPAGWNSEGCSLVVFGAGGTSSQVDPGPEGENRTIPEELSALVQEREQLQRKLQEALASRKEAIKKAKEKDRHHRELLKQQKDDYNLLQGQFEQQSQEKESLQDQLRALSLALESCSPPKRAGVAYPEGPAPGLVQELGQEVFAEGASLAAEDLAVGQLKVDFEKLQAEKRELEAQIRHLEGELDSKSEETLLLQEKIKQLLAEVEMAKAACGQAEASVVSLKLELQESQIAIASLRCHQEQKELSSREEIRGLNSELSDKEKSLHGLQAELQEKENAIRVLQGQLEQAQQLQVELQQKSAGESAESQAKAQLQRRLQAALISRKEALKESKGLRDELASTKASLESTSLHLLDVESRVSELDKERVVLLEKLASLGEEREKLISTVDEALVENQNITGSCESLKLALEGVTQEKTRLEKEMGTLQQTQAQELSEWQRKHKELQKDYESLLQSYENVSNEAERIQRVVESVRQEKQELFLRLKVLEAEKEEGEARLQGAEQEMEGMREKMRKFAKSKQQKILELEEENEQLRSEIHSVDSRPGGTNSGLQEELETSKKNCQALSDQLKVLIAEKDFLNQEIQDLRQTLQNKEDRADLSSIQEEMVGKSKADSSTMISSSEEAADEQGPSTGPELLPPTALSLEDKKEDLSTVSPLHDERIGDIQQVAQLQEQAAALEEKGKMAAEEVTKTHGDLEALKEEKKGLEDLLAVKGQELEALQEKVIKLEKACGQTKEQLAEVLMLKEALEIEKDDLEERLMNQLAELNGSIGNYQQDIANLESKNQQLLSEVESLQGALSHLEDEKRHLLREKFEVEVEKKENMEKAKSTWKEDSGRTQTKELQELLKEKQQEVRQLQRDCIKSQEKISGLERTIKALEFVQSESKRELEATKESMAEAGENTKKVQAELASCRVLLDDTQSEAARVVAESLKLKEELQATKAQLRGQLSQKEKELEGHLEQEKAKHLKEIRNLEERLESLQKKQVCAEESVRDLQESLRQKDQDAKQLQGSLNHALAQLAAFSRSMSSLQDDRDRVIDESRQWEKKFSEAIEKKEQELRAGEQACAALQEQAKKTAVQVEDLQGLVASLERSKSAQESHAQEELQHRQEEVRLLQEENSKLELQLEEAQQLLSNSQSQVLQQGGELGSLRKQLADLQDSFEDSEKARVEMSETVKSHEAVLQNYRFSLEQLEADLQASKELTDRLHAEMSCKEQKIVSLVAAKEEAVAGAVFEIQQQHKEELKELENQVAKAEVEKVALEADKAKAQEKVHSLMEKLRNTHEESKLHKAQLDAFTKSMSSLQDDRDRVLEDYRQLEQRHLAAILEKDQLIQEAAAENNALKEELRNLHGQMDDLNAENAKLDAELVRYREDLNQVISIKDSQQKQLLKTQMERIQALEKEKAGVEGQLRESKRSLANLQQTVEALQLEKHNLEQEVRALKSSLSQMQNEVLALQEGGPMLELQVQLQDRVDEVEKLGGQLLLAKQQVTGLEAELADLHQTTSRKIYEAEAKMEKELKSFHHDTGLLRNETETAEERVAELAKDLLEMEQNLLVVTEENQDLKAQIQSFKKAMSSLQDSWDQSNEERRAMGKKYAVDLEEQRQLVQNLHEEKLQFQEVQRTLEKQRDSLTSELAALRDSEEEKGLSDKLEKLSQQLQSKDSQLVRLSSELERASAQVKSFSQAMASLQAERDRLLSELDKTRKMEEVKLQSAASASASLAEVPSLKKALSSLQNDRDRLLVELESLQQRCLQMGVDAAETTRLKAQLQQQKQEMEQQQQLQEKLKQESASWQLELHQLREEKAAWELGKQAVEKQRPREGAPGRAGSGREASGPMAAVEDLQAQLGSSLKDLHQKELRIQQLNSKLSQVFEEKSALALQLRGSSRSLRESHQRHGEAVARCEALEKKLQELQLPAKARGPVPTDAAPGAPQEKGEPSGESSARQLQELQMQLSEAKQQHSSARQGLAQLQQLLQDERDRRLAAEEACSVAQEQIRRLESEEWAHSLDTSIEMPPGPEHALLLGPASEGSFSKARGGRGLQRVLRALFCPRRLLSLLAIIYLFAIHVLLLLHVVGRL